MIKLEKNDFYNKLDSKIPGGDRPAVKGPSRRLYFTKLNMESLEEMFHYSRDQRLYEYFEFPPQKTITETETYLKKLFKRIGNDPQNRDAMYWFIRRIEDDRLVGTFCLVNIDFNRSSVEWGYGVDPDLWGHAYPLEIMNVAKNYIFNDLKLNRIWGQTMESNGKTISSLLAAGCKEEGILRDFYCKNNVFHNAWAYSLLLKDFKLESTSSSCQKITISPEDIAKIVESIIGEKITTFDTDMDHFPAWDSITHFDVVVKLQDQLKCSFSPEEIAELRSINRISKIVSSK